LSRLETSDVPPRRRILIVDDNVQAADSLGVLLSAFLGQDVRVAYRGDAALDVARSFRPQVVLLDLEMPGMDGYEVATRLRMQTEFSDLVIVALTGWGHEEHRQRSREIGFDVHMIKPVTAKDLRGMLLELAPMTEKRSLAKPEIVCQTS
jgi:CheY-like chemotaxis protein